MFRKFSRRSSTLLKLCACAVVTFLCIVFWIGEIPDRDARVAKRLDLHRKHIKSEKLSNSEIERPRNDTTKTTRFDDVILYNRVPKCGSTSTRTLLQHVAKKTRLLDVHVSKVYAQEYLNETGQEGFVNSVLSLDRPLLFIRHVFFVDFTKFGHLQPIYINMIRDPLDRLVSDYYFKRFNLAHMFPISEERRDRSYSDCVLGNHSECVHGSPKGFFRVIPYFCGMDKRCLTPSEWSLTQAKRHIDQYYGVVGTVEQMDQFIALLEWTWSEYFTDISRAYKLSGDRLRSLARAAKKDPVDPQARAVMMDKLTYDYDLYHYVQQRFHQQYTDMDM